MANKILVEIIDKSGIKKRKKCRVEQHHVLIRKAKGKGRKYQPAWKAQFNEESLIYYRGMWPFRFLKRKLMVIDGHKECIKWNFETKVLDFSEWDVAQYFKAEVIEKAGTSKTKLEVPILLYGFFGILIVMQLLTLLVNTGRLRL